MAENASPNVLIVDDEDDVRTLYQGFLEDLGHNCHTASNAYEALDILATEAVDVALVDITMPGMSGLTLFDRMNERHPSVAVIFVRAMDDTAIAVANLKQGAYGYLIKPVTLARLELSVEEALDRRPRRARQSQGVDVPGGVPADGIYEGTVLLSVIHQGDPRNVFPFVEELLEDPRLRLFGIINSGETRLDISLGLAEPMRLEDVLDQMSGVCLDVAGSDNVDCGAEGQSVLNLRLTGYPS